jgi:hypothetical protein
MDKSSNEGKPYSDPPMALAQLSCHCAISRPVHKPSMACKTVQPRHSIHVACSVGEALTSVQGHLQLTFYLVAALAHLQHRDGNGVGSIVALTGQ